MPTYFAGRGDVAVARMIIEEVDDAPYCGERGNSDHRVCLVTPRVASWPDPHPLHDLDDPDWEE